MLAERSVVLIPLKDFNLAKGRLAAVLTPPERVQLSKAMAARVVAAAAPLTTWVVCDDEGVAEWARAQGAQVEWTPGLGLNGAVQTAYERAGERGEARVVVAHGDLPFASGIASLAEAEPTTLRIVADRHGTGTNVMSLPTGTPFTFRYGPGSFDAHCTEAAHAGLLVSVEPVESLAWDVDEPADLDSPAGLGPIPRH